MNNAETPEKVQAFKAYLEEQGVNAFLVEAISDLYSAQPRPSDALKFLQQRLADTISNRKEPQRGTSVEAGKGETRPNQETEPAESEGR
jgi:hypothetical protein